jgi:uncharacterized protein
LRVLELWRYPVKSLAGERVDATAITYDGLVGDRAYALFDLETGNGLTARRSPELLFASATWNDDGSVEIVLPDGSVAKDDDALSQWLGRAVQLRAAAQQGERRYENPADFEHEDASAWTVWHGPRGPFHDSTRARVSLVSTGTIGAWDPRRFRANVLLDGEGEDALVGARVALGGAVLEVQKRIDRCVMTTRPQPDGIERDLDVLRTINRERDGCLAIGALVDRPGDVRVGDELLRV